MQIKLIQQIKQTLLEKQKIILNRYFYVFLFIAIILVSSDLWAITIGAGGFEGKIKNLQDKFLNVILPIVAIFGLGYAGILAATGNEGAKGKIVLCLIGSAIAFLAPYIIAFVQNAVGN
ncbi:MAG: hypothetical protein HQK51_05555 [Oligoflexia bacterium]|nr:hypothetical protein [Oligoflexia bacterium]